MKNIKIKSLFMVSLLLVGCEKNLESKNISHNNHSIDFVLNGGDKILMNDALQNALENSKKGQVVKWENSQTNNHGIIVITKTTKREDGTYCRSYEQNLSINKKQEKQIGTFCRESKNNWKRVF